jgi:hypothetical protein
MTFNLFARRVNEIPQDKKGGNVAPPFLFSIRRFKTTGFSRSALSWVGWVEQSVTHHFPGAG